MSLPIYSPSTLGFSLPPTSKKALKLELQPLNVVFLKKLFQNQLSKKTLYKYDYYAEMGGIPVKFFFRSYTKINFMAKVGTSQL